MVLVLYATLLPREVRFQIGDLQFFADRIGLILILPYLIRKLIDGAVHFVLPDWLMLGFGVWILISMFVNMGPLDGLKSGGSLALDSTVGYFLARVSFRRLNDLRRILILFAPGVFVVAIVMATESILHREIIAPLAQSIFGRLPIYEGTTATDVFDVRTFTRLGLMRARGPFVHAIVGGLYLASLFPVFALSGLRGWPRMAGLLAASACLFTVSSAAVMGLFLGLALVFYEAVEQKSIFLTWRSLLLVSGLAFVVLSLGSKSGAISVLIRYFTLDPTTGYYRQLIWDYAGNSVGLHPWFGLGFAEWERPSWMVSNSIDAHWLLMAVRYGLPAAILLGLAVLSALLGLAAAGRHIGTRDRSTFHGLALAIGIMSIMMFTVTLWGGAQTWFNILLGACVACTQWVYISLIRLSAES